MTLDVEFDDGVLSFVLANVGDSAAVNVSTTLDKKIMGLAGSREINGLNIFKKVTFFPASKRFKFLLDSTSSYFARKEPTRFTATISYSDGEGRLYAEKITHDLEIYRDLPYLLERKSSTLSA